MPGEPPRGAPSRESSRPGDKRWLRGGAREPVADEPDESAEPAGDTAQANARTRRRVLSTLALGVTHRIIALVVTVAVLAISFVSSYSVYLAQQKDIAATKAEIAEHEAEIARLQDELSRWADPAYVRAQARERLGWVLPGEIGYRVIDADGAIIGGTVGVSDTGEDEAPLVWYDALWTSLATADAPAPDPAAQPSGPATVGPDGVEPPR
jgi:cell division protein FtsB